MTTEVVRDFNPILERPKVDPSGETIILENNKFEAVMSSVKEYEHLEEAVKLLENIYKN